MNAEGRSAAERAMNKEMPSNAELKGALEDVQKTLDTQAKEKKLEGKSLEATKHAEQFLEVTKELLEKNKGEKLQKLVDLGKETGEKTKEGMPSMREARTIGQKVNRILYLLQPMIKSVITSAEFRRSTIELFDLLDEIFVERRNVGEPIRFEMERGETGEVTEGIQRTGEKIRNTELTEEERKDINRKFNKFLKSLSKNPEFRVALNNFYEIVEILRKRVSSVQKVADKEEKKAREVERTTKELVEEFTGNKSVDPFVNHAKDLIQRIQNDQELNQYFEKLKRHFNDAFDHPELLDSEEFVERGDKLWKEGDRLSREKNYDDDWRVLSDEGRELIEEIQKDEVINSMKERGQILAEDFVYTGVDQKHHLDIDLLTDMKKLVVPVLIEQLKRIPIPKFTGSSDTYDYEIDNLEFLTGDILPDNIRIKTKSDTNFNIRDLTAQVKENMAKIQIENIRPCFKGIKFAFERKTFPKMKDSGTMDVDFTGDGVSLTIVLNLVKAENKPPKFEYSNVDFDIDKMKLNFREDTNHPHLLSFFTTILKPTISKKSELAIQDRIKEIVIDLCKQLNDLVKQAYKNTMTGIETGIAEGIVKMTGN